MFLPAVCLLCALEQRPSALALLSTIEPVFQCATSPLDDRAGRPDPAPPPAYCKLFPPYMHDVYAFLAALQQEVSARWIRECMQNIVVLGFRKAKTLFCLHLIAIDVSLS